MCVFCYKMNSFTTLFLAETFITWMLLLMHTQRHTHTHPHTDNIKETANKYISSLRRCWTFKTFYWLWVVCSQTVLRSLTSWNHYSFLCSLSYKMNNVMECLVAQLKADKSHYWQHRWLCSESLALQFHNGTWGFCKTRRGNGDDQNPHMI